jgi:hypothetical protein
MSGRFHDPAAVSPGKPPPPPPRYPQHSKLGWPRGRTGRGEKYFVRNHKKLNISERRPFNIVRKLIKSVILNSFWLQQLYDVKPFSEGRSKGFSRLVLGLGTWGDGAEYPTRVFALMIRSHEHLFISPTPSYRDLTNRGPSDFYF